MKKQNKKNKSNKIIVLGIILLLLIMITLLGIAYGYFRTKVVGNTGEEKSINNPSKLLKVVYEDDNPEVVTDPLYGPGRTVSKDFKVRNAGDDTGNYSIILDNIENTLERTWDIRYTLKDKAGKELVKGTLGKELTKQMVYADISIEVGELDEYTLELEYEETNKDQSIDMGKKISFKIDIIEAHENIFKDITGEDTLLYAIGRDNEVVNPLTIPGQQASKAEEAELSYTEDDYGTSYYYRGNVQNNYVTFANMCWRIVRVLGNGNIKITLYDEAYGCADSAENPKEAFMSSEGKGETPYKTAYKNSYGNKKYVKFELSTIKSALDDWYDFPDVNLNTYADKIEQEVEWCNDVSETTGDDGTTYFGAYNRLFLTSTAQPSLKCPETEDTDMGSSKYIDTIALLTADEMAFAGSSSSGSSWDYYLQENATEEYYTMSPFTNRGVIPNVYGVKAWGGMGEAYVNGWAPVRPAIVLTYNVKVTPDSNGTKTNPYFLS